MAERQNCKQQPPTGGFLLGKRMINEQLPPSEKPITALPNNRPKAKESLEIAALTAEFLARGGQIKRAKGNQLHVAMNPLAQDIWPEREKLENIVKEWV